MAVFRAFESHEQGKVTSASQIPARSRVRFPSLMRTRQLDRANAHRRIGQHASAAMVASRYRRRAVTPLPGTVVARCLATGNALNS